MATGNPLHRDTADRFNDENYQQPFYGTSNVTVIRGKDTKQSGFSANTNQAPRKNLRQTQFNKQETNPDQDNNFNPGQNQSRAIRSSKQKMGVLEYGRKLAARVTTPLVSVLLYILIGFCAPIQLALGVLAGVALFVGAGLFTISDDATLISAVLGYAGVTPENFVFIYLGVSGLILVLNCIQIIIGVILFKFAQAHPLGGWGSTFKIVSLMVIVIASFFPLLQIIPLVWIWISIVNLNPR